MNDLELLRTIDPAEDTHDDDRAAEQLLRMVLASPRPTRRRRRRALIALPVAAALLAALALALDRGGESLAAKAYAATAPGEEIVHEVSEFAVGPSGRVVMTEESWWRPADGTARWVMYVENKKRSEFVIGADGVARLQPPFASYPGDGVLNPHGSDSARKFVDGMRSVTLSFREDYAGQPLHDDGTTTLDGRTVHAYSAVTKEWFREDHAYTTYHRTFYLDPETAMPVAERVVTPRPGAAPVVSQTTVKTYEKLPATPENLALLRSQTSP